MLKKLVIIGILIIFIIIAAQPAATLSGKGIVQLKKAGVSDQTIELIAKEKVIETAAFSIDEIVAMKQAGVGETTLQMLVKEGSFLRSSEPIVYGNSTRSIRLRTAQDVIELKQAGLSDEVIQAIIAVTGERYYSQHEEAYDLLRGMGIVVDTRGDRQDRPQDPKKDHKK
ncbi:hypothetical protein D1BOALGB6SA_4438 [Olavius sp. associated proteobacterium Delta 1]|nr:hypothetical protein D1BOALGB6SA_4438 [Olavius sp. associated proteobacterium Delta 1]